MTETTPFSEDPLPGQEPQAKTPGSAEPDHNTESAAGEELHDPDLKPLASEGHSNPDALTTVHSTELQDPDLQVAEPYTLPDPDLQPVLAAEPKEMDTTAQAEIDSTGKDLSNWPLHLAHLAQVGLVDADQWDEQIKPRIDQLHEDIDQVNEQLDELELAKRKTKKS